MPEFLQILTYLLWNIRHLRSQNTTMFEVNACLSSGPSVNSWSGETAEKSIQQPEGVWLRPEQRRSDIQTVAHCIMATWKHMFWKELNSTFHIPVNFVDRKKRQVCICFTTVSTLDYLEKIKKCNRKLYLMCFQNDNLESKEQYIMQ